MNLRSFEYRVLAAVILLTASLICASLARPRRIHPCAGAQTDAYDYCLGLKNPNGTWRYTVDQCIAYADAKFQQCAATRKSGGPSNPSPPPLPVRKRPPTPVGVAPPPSQSPPPLGLKPPITGPVTTKGPVASPTPTAPTIFAKPKATPPPHKDHQDHHH
jgi:hypothetical protein